MRIDVRDEDGHRVGRIEVDPDQRPNLVPIVPAGGAGEADRQQPAERYLAWDGAVDDAGHLRHCLVCGSSSLYRGKTLPQVTPFVVLLAFAGAVVGFLGYATNPVVLPALVVLLIVDVATLLLARPRLVCYRCGSVYTRLRIARYHRPWDRNEAERIQNERQTPPPPPGPVARPPAP